MTKNDKVIAARLSAITQVQPPILSVAAALVSLQDLREKYRNQTITLANLTDMKNIGRK